MKNNFWQISLFILLVFICKNGFSQKIQIPVDLAIVQQKLNANQPFEIHDWEIEEFERSYTSSNELNYLYKMDESLDKLKSDFNEKLLDKPLDSLRFPQNITIPLFINKNGHLGFFEYDNRSNLIHNTIKKALLNTSGDWVGQTIRKGNQAAFIKLKIYYDSDIINHSSGRKVHIQIDSVKIVDQYKRLKAEYDDFKLFHPVIFKEDLNNKLNFLNKKGKIIHLDSLNKELYQLTSKTEYPLAETIYHTIYRLNVQFNEDGSNELLNIDGYDFEENYPHKAYRQVFIAQFETFLPRLRNPKYQGKYLPFRYSFHVNSNIDASRKTLNISTFGMVGNAFNSRTEPKKSANFKIVSNTPQFGTDSIAFNSTEKSGYQISYNKGYYQLVNELIKLLEDVVINPNSPEKDSLHIRFVVDYGLFGFISDDQVLDSNHKIIRNTLKKLGNNWIPANASGYGEKGYQSIGEIVCHYQTVKDHSEKNRLVIAQIKPVWTRQYKIKKEESN